MIIVLDTETGGLNCKEDAICSISVSTIDKVYKKTWYIKPYKKNYSQEALEVNGLSKELLEQKGLPFDDVKRELLEFFNYIRRGQRIKLLGQNITFDIGFLKEFLTEQVYEQYFHYHFKDTMIVAEFFKDAGLIDSKQRLRLEDLHKHFFPESSLSESSHSSSTDVEMCIDIYEKMQEVVKQ